MRYEALLWPRPNLELSLDWGAHLCSWLQVLLTWCLALQECSVNKSQFEGSVWLQCRMRNMPLLIETISCTVLRLCQGHPSSKVSWNFTWLCRWWQHEEPLPHGGDGWEHSLTLLLRQGSFAMGLNLPPFLPFLLQHWCQPLAVH